jgi:hypothetical protein
MVVDCSELGAVDRRGGGVDSEERSSEDTESAGELLSVAIGGGDELWLEFSEWSDLCLWCV